MKLLATLFLLTLSMNSFADQCQYVTAESATTATKLISLSKKNSGGVLNLCQNCGEKTPTEIRVNQIDISSTGVTEAPAEAWVNLGKLSNCPVTGASEFITEKKSSDGRVQYIPSAKY
jgi:hypothetical protein